MFSVRLVTADSYQAQPLPQLDATFSEFRGSEIKNVPVIRIFGTTFTGEKTCLHIHGVFPYLYVPFTGEENPSTLAYKLAASLDAAINVSLGSATANTQHVYSIQRVSGIPFYGYHRKEHQYLKIYFYNPAMMKRAADLLQNGSVLNQSLQPHEAHIPYLLQFMIDYNVYGMSLVKLNSVKHRRLTQTLGDVTSSGQSLASDDNEIDYLPATVERQSTCELEIDALASDIINRREIANDMELNPGLAAIWEEERARRGQAGLQGGDSQLVNPKSPARPTFRPTDNDIYQEQRLARRLLAISQSDESSLSTTINKSIAYPAEIQEGDNLMNSNHLPSSRPTTERSQFVGRDDAKLAATPPDSPTQIMSLRMTPECSILGTDDMPLIDLLAQLADASDEKEKTVEADSLLGSQISEFLNDEKNENDDDDEAIDLNLTSLQLDSLSCHETVIDEQTVKPSSNEKNSLVTIHLSPLASSCDSWESSKSSVNEKTKKIRRMPQYDGAGDVSPTLLNSEDEDGTKNPKEFSHLPEYNGNSEVSSKARNWDRNEHCKQILSSKENEKNFIETCDNSSSIDVAIEAPPLINNLANDAYMAQYNGFNYEPFDRLLEISPEYVPDLDSMHSSMEIGRFITGGESDSSKSVDEIIDDDPTIPLETVLNGDPCFTESAELDKSDVTELRDQYASLLGNSLLPDIHNDLRIDSDLGNSSNFTDSDYQTSEKTCEMLLNVRNTRSSMTSPENSSSSENVAPNIQYNVTKNCSRGQLNANYVIDKDSKNVKESIRICNDNSDYNCNVVATWAELQNVHIVEKEKTDGRLSMSKDREPRQSTSRRHGRRSDERAPSQIFRSDCQTIFNGTTSTLGSHKTVYNSSLTSEKVFTDIGTNIETKRSTDVPPSQFLIGETIVKTTTKDVEERCNVRKKKFEAPKLSDIPNKPEIVTHQWLSNSDCCERLDAIDNSTINSDNGQSTDTDNSFTATCNTVKNDNPSAIADLEVTPENWLEQFDNPLRIKKISEGSSYYSSQRSQRDYTIDGFEHRHCQLTKHNKIIQDEIFTSEQVWVIEKEKERRLTKTRLIDPGVCNNVDCSVPIVPIVPLTINSENFDIASTTISEKIPKLDADTKTKTLTADVPAKKILLPKKMPKISRTSRVRRKRLSSLRSDSSVDGRSLISNFRAVDEDCDSINEVIDAVVNGNSEEPKNAESIECGQSKFRSNLVQDCLDGDESVYSPHGPKTRYSRVKRFMGGNSKKNITTRTSRVTRNGLRQRSSRTYEREENHHSGIPGIPGINEYRAHPITDLFTCYKNVKNENNKSIETLRKQKNKRKSLLLANWEFKRELSNRRSNGLTNLIENEIITDNRKITVIPNGSTNNFSQFVSPPVSPIPKKTRSRRVRTNNSSYTSNRSSTPNNITSSEISGSNDDKLPEYVALNLMMQEVRCRNTRAKLKFLVKKRNTDRSNLLTENLTLANPDIKSYIREKGLSENETAIPASSKDPKFSSIFVPSDGTEDSGEHEEIQRQKPIADVVAEPSFATLTARSNDNCRRINCVSNPVDVNDVTNIFSTSNSNPDISNTEIVEDPKIFENDLDMLETEISESNTIEEFPNDRKDMSYHNEQIQNVVVDTNFFAGNHYTIDAVSLEMPACLFEEDSNSIDKRSIKKFNDHRSTISNDSDNVNDYCTDVSVDPRDLDVYDVESLTPSSSLACFDVSSCDLSEATQSSLPDNSIEPHNPNDCCQQTFQNRSGSEEICDSIIEETSTNFEALSPKPRISDSRESLDNEFIVRSEIAITKDHRKINNSVIFTNNDSHEKLFEERKITGEDENSQLDHEIQDLVSQVVVRFENEKNVSRESESMIVQISPTRKNECTIVAPGETECQRIVKPGSFARTNGSKRRSIATEENKKILTDDERMNCSKSETNENLEPSVEQQNLLSNDNQSEKVTIFAIIQNKKQPNVLESQMKFSHIWTSELDVTNKRLEMNNENLQSIKSVTNEKNDNDENRTSDVIDDCTLINENLSNISSAVVSVKPPKIRPVSIKLVNVDLSRFEGLCPKNFTSIRSVRDKVDNTEAETSVDKNIIESTSRIKTDDNIEKIIPLKFRTKETSLVENKTIDHSKEIIIPQSSLPRETYDDGATLDKLIQSATTNPIESIDAGVTRVTSVPLIKVTTLKNSREKTRKIFNASEHRQRKNTRKCAEKTRQNHSEQVSKDFTTAKCQSSTKEKNQLRENDHDRETEKSEESLSRETSFVDGKLSYVILDNHRIVNLIDAESLKYPSIEKHYENTTENDLPDESLIPSSPTKERETDNCHESVRLAETTADENTAPHIKWRRKYHVRKSLQENSREPSPEILASTSKNSSAEELSRIIMDENTKPKIPRYYPDVKKVANGRRIKPEKMKRSTALRRQLLINLPSENPTEIVVDSKPLVQQIAPGKMVQENSWSVYDQPLSRKLRIKRVRTMNSDSSRESKLLDEQKNLLKSDTVPRLIDEDIVNLDLIETTEQINRSTNISQTNVNVSSYAESIEQLVKINDNETDNQANELTSKEISNDDTYDDIVPKTHNVDFKSHQRVSESSSSGEEKSLTVSEPISVVSELLPIKIVNNARRRIRNTSKRRLRRGRRLQPRNRKSCSNNGNRRDVNTNCEELNLSPLKMVKDRIKTRVGSKRRYRSQKCSQPKIRVSCPEIRSLQDDNVRVFSENMVESKNCTDPHDSELIVQRNASPEKSAHRRTKLFPRKIASVRIAPGIKGTSGRRKFSKSNAEEPKSILLIKEKVSNTDENIHAISVASELSERIEMKNCKSKILTDIAIANVNDSNSFIEESVERSELILRNVAETSIEREACLRVKKRGRPPKILRSRIRKSSTKIVPLITENNETIDEIRCEKLDENKSEPKILFNPDYSNSKVSKPYSASTSLTEKFPRCSEEKIFKDSSNEIIEENENPNYPLNQLAVNEKHENDDNRSLDNSLLSERNAGINVENKKTNSPESSEVIWNNGDKSYSKVDSSIIATRVDDESEMSLESRYFTLNRRKSSSLSESSSIENSRTTAEKDFQDKDSFLTNTAKGIFETINSVEPEEPCSLRKKRQDKTRKTVSKSVPSFHENNDNVNMDNEKSKLFPRSIEQPNIGPKTAAKSKISFKKNSESNIREVFSDDNCESVNCSSEPSDDGPMVFKRRGRFLNAARLNSSNVETTVDESVYEEATRKVEFSVSKHEETKDFVTFERNTSTENNSETNLQRSCSKNDNFEIAKETCRDEKIVSRNKNSPKKRKKLTKSQQNLSLCEISEEPVDVKFIDDDKDHRRRTISETIADVSSESSKSSTKNINQTLTEIIPRGIELLSRKPDEKNRKSRSKSGVHESVDAKKKNNLQKISGTNDDEPSSEKIYQNIVSRISRQIVVSPEKKDDDENSKLKNKPAEIDEISQQSTSSFEKIVKKNVWRSSTKIGLLPVNDEEENVEPGREPIETELINSNKKTRYFNASLSISNKMSQQSASSADEINQKITKIKSIVIKKKSRSGKNPEYTTEPLAKEISLDIEPKITENYAESKDLTGNTMRSRTENITEANANIIESSAEQLQVRDSDVTLSEIKSLPEEVPKEISKDRVSVRFEKRGNYDINSIRACTVNIRSFETIVDQKISESPPNKYNKYSPTILNGESRRAKTMDQKKTKKLRTIRKKSPRVAVNPTIDPSTLGDVDNQRIKRNKNRRCKNNGVSDESKFSINSSNNASYDLSSLQNVLTNQRRHYNTRGFSTEPTAKIHDEKQTNPFDDALTFPTTRFNDSKTSIITKNIEFSRNFDACPLDAESLRRRSELDRRRLIELVQLREPKIILKRLNRRTLKTYGFKFNERNKIFVKISNKCHSDNDHRVPAYDGPADILSSDEDDDPTDVTIVSEEKRVCVYQSGKKSFKTSKETTVVTPNKRKLIDDADTVSPMKKHKTLATPGTCSKTSYSSPNRTNTLKSPGRGSGYYRPLQIIVTSPKVRGDTSESLDTVVRLENQRSTSFAESPNLTPRRKNDQRLHENLLRGRISTIKLPRPDRGDKPSSVTTGGSQRAGELDEIKWDMQEEMNVPKTSTITSECSEATGIKNLTSRLRDGKDVRKKLVFSTTNDETPKSANDGQSSNFQNFDKPVAHSSTTNHETRKSLESFENSIKRVNPPFVPKRGSSRSNDFSVVEDAQMYDVTTDDESEDENVCDVTFTQYIDSHVEKNQTIALDRNKIAMDSCENISMRPKFDPPSRRKIVETMEACGIPKYRNEEPFFSDEADIPKQKELAQKMLKVGGKGLKDVPMFVSSVEGVTGLVRWRRTKINEFHPNLAKLKGTNAIRALVADDFVSMTPLMKPPSRREIEKWLKAREYVEKKKNHEETAKKTEVSRKMIIQRESVETRKNEGESNDWDLSVIEATPEKTVGGDETKKNVNYSLKMKMDEWELRDKSEEFCEMKFVSSKNERAKDSLKNSCMVEESTTKENFTTDEIDPSLLSLLDKSRLFKNQESSRHHGVSYGQIEFLSDSTRSNVANENLQNAKALTRYQYITIMCLEVHVTTRGDLLPDAQHDPIAAIFYSVQSDVPPTSSIKPLEHGVIIMADDENAKNKMHYSYASNVPWSVSFANNEEALLNVLVSLITRVDPEILIGWQLETLSWGYVFQRASRLGMDLSKRISRIPATQCKWETVVPDIETVADVKLPGRIVLDIWRLMRHEAALLSYTFESVIHHVLSERVPCPSFKILTDWWNLQRSRSSRWRVVEHYAVRILGIFRMLNQLDIIGRTSELARLFGIQFYEVFSRGSQYRVESVMLRLAKPLNYIAVSPTPLQRASMRAMEALPLILEPESTLYTDPLIVLDFQSLYPSIIIAHNYCFSTCLGRVEHIGQPEPFEFGAYTLRVPKSTSLKLQGKMNFAPCGVAFVKPEIRLGILPRMLTEILDTRFMVKKAMKDHDQSDKTLQRALHSRQHGLKFLANVTYGYTAANFSGRMPCIEVGDSVISKSKETLERAIKLVESTPKWGARVVYGDTDSLFILVPGKSKADAFVIGNEIADAVTAANPTPIKLKFEKVMYPSILQTKKRYCGYMYETPDQQTPTYLAKGIETVRRDGCPAVSKILEKTLKILFDTKDLSLVKKYVTRQLDKVLRGKVSIADLTFAKEFRGLKGYKARACVPALELTRRLMRKDPRAVPRNNERVRYIIVAGAPNQALIHCVRTPWELIEDPGLRPNALYYVTRVIIPPLNRCLNLIGVDVNAWYRDMPHRQIRDNPVGQPVDKHKLTIFQYFGTIVCVSCGEPSTKGICTECLAHPADTLVILYEKLRWLHRTYDQVTAICQSCSGQADVAHCSSLDCPVLYRRAYAKRELSQATHLRSLIESGNDLEF